MSAVNDHRRPQSSGSLPRRTVVNAEPWREVIEKLEQRLLLRVPIHNVPHNSPAKPGPEDHAPAYQEILPRVGEQRWPINFDASHVRELAPETIDPATGISPPNRVLDPADIQWVNRGQASDNFAAIFGTFAAQARAVVDAVIVRYEQMINSFDYPSAGQHYSLTLSMAAAGSGFGASANLSTSLGGKPFSGSISMGSGTGTGTNTDHGWFLDPTPFENSEFEGNIVNAFAGDAQSGSPADGRGDFFTVVAAEMTHCMGLFGSALAGWSSHTTNTGIHDGVTGVGSYWTFVGPSISHLGTSDNAGTGDFGNFIHSAEGASNINFAGQFWRGAEDQGNAFYEFSRRYLINNTFSLMFHDAYGYTSVNPAQFGTMYSILQSNGTLLVRGSSATSNDLIYVDASGSNLVISVDVGTDVGGTGPFAGDQNLPAFVTVIPASSVSTINVQAGLGNDIVRIENNAGKSTNVDGGPGDDFTDFSFGNRFWDNIQGFTNVFGGTGVDSIFMYDNANVNADTYTIDSAEVNRPFFGGMFYGADVENLTVWAGTPVNTVNIPSTYFATANFINNAGGNDVVNIGQASNGVQSIAGYLQIQNDPAFSVITVNDTGDTTARTGTHDTVILSSAPFGRITGLAPAIIDYQYLDTSTISVVMGNASGDTLNIIADGKPFTVGNAGGLDNVNIGGASNGAQQIVAAINVTNPPSFTTMSVNDSGDGVARTITMDNNGTTGTLSGIAPALISWPQIDISTVNITAGGGLDTFNLPRTTEVVSYNGNGSHDIVNIGNATNGVQSIFANVTLFNPPSFNVININDNGDATARSVTHDTVSISSSNYGRITGLAPATIDYKYADTEALNLTLGGGNDTMNILRDGATFNLSNWSGAGDTINIGNTTTGMQEISGALTMVNPPAFDVITFNDAANATGRNFTHTIVNVSGDNYGQLTGLAPATIMYKVNDTSSTTYLAGTGTDTANFVETATSPRFIPAVYRQSDGFDTINVNGDNVGSATVNFPDTERLGALNVGAAGLVNMQASGNHVLLTRALSVNASGKIDMFDNDMILDYPAASQLAAVQALINTGRSGGTWLGNGITSTTARNNVNHNTTLGAMESSDYKGIYGAGATFDGETIDTTAVLVKYTYYGDADFNGKVNFDDYVRTDNGFNNHRTGWVNGDYNGNGVVNFDDYVLIDQAFNTQSGVL